MTHSALLLFLPGQTADRLVILVLALGLDWLVGDLPLIFRYVPHPVVLIGRAIALFDRRLNREARSARTRRWRGVITLVAMVVSAALVGVILSFIATRFGRWSGLVELLIVAVLVAQRSLHDHVVRVMRALDAEGLAAGRVAVSHIVGRDPASLDAHGVARAGIESLAENFSDGVVAPVLAYALAGLPGLIVYKTVNTLDSMIGHKTPRHIAFGWASARFDDLLNLVPARLSGLLVGAAALFVPRGTPVRALRTMLRDAGKHRSPNAGWPEAAMAGALDLALAGPRRYGDIVVTDPWMGDGRARATVADMAAALRVFRVACLLEVLALGTAAVVLTF
ncbi:cobalamin biosynthesis protein CobD [Aliidongia dinghuensis]|uniref:Cobalamin biosynthesis protein CobD n=1 Tax=Aliidongia dinghuensis TaxID=1867774 RepID=A0A8J2YQK5_9PROT|nr:adenosylcobinamide-phosphate synthase CbiB [Aliidongia dinghuensis]GGF02646.1 cobalamin biosynthesis protein CobD [Aliidongia dinghuensis]